MLQLVPSENRAHRVNTVEAASTASPRTRTHKAPAARPSRWLRLTIARPAHTTAPTHTAMPTAASTWATSGSGVVSRCVHRDASRDLRGLATPGSVDHVTPV